MRRRWNLDEVDVDEFLRLLEVDVLSRSGVNAIFSCPFHGVDAHPSARMNVHTTAFVCSSCGAKGNSVHFLSRLRGMDEEEALAWIQVQFHIADAGIGDVAPDELGRIVRLNLDRTKPPGVSLTPPDEAWVPYLMNAWEDAPDGAHALDYLLGRGFDPGVLDLWGVGYDDLSRRIAIPVRDVDGDLVGFKGRCVADEQDVRYKLLGDVPGANWVRYGFNTYPKSEHVFGLCFLPPQSSAIICEGELNVVAISQKTRHLAVGVAGSEFSERQRELIVSRCSEAIVYFDDDNAGVRGVHKVSKALMPYMPVSVVWRPPDDAANLSGAEIDNLVSQAIPATLLHTYGLISLTDFAAT